MNRQFSKEDIQVVSKHMERCSTIVIREEFPGGPVVETFTEAGPGYHPW